jgi:hypothetical protein
LFAHGRWFSPGTPASSTTKTGRHDIAEILLKVTLNTINQSLNQSNPKLKKLLVIKQRYIVLVTFSNISAISWRPVLVVEEAGVPGENHRPWANNW